MTVMLVLLLVFNVCVVRECEGDRYAGVSVLVIGPYTKADNTAASV